MRTNSVNKVFLLHLIFQIPGIIALAHYLAELFRQIWEQKHHIANLAAWAIQPSPPKIESILEYAFLVVIGASLILYFSSFSRRDRGEIEVRRWGWAILGLYELVCLLTPTQTGMPLAWFVIALILPLWVHSRNQQSLSNFIERAYFFTSVGVLCGALGILSTTSWNSDVRFINDYADFPEYTIMDDGHEAENREFLKAHRIHGWFKEDPCEKLDRHVSSQCFHLSKTVFRDALDPFLLFPPGSGVAYNWKDQTLVAYRPFKENEKALIQSLWGIKPTVLENDEHLPSIYQQTKDGLSKVADSNSTDAIRSGQEQEFLNKNVIEMNSQKELGRFFYHHSYLYLPALESVISDHDRIIPAQYGEGLTRTIGAIINYDGNPTFQAYYKVFWAGLYAYLIVLGIVAWIITRNAWAAIFALTLGISCILAISNDALRMAPGFNPIRHFPDLLCFLAIFYNVRRKTYISAVMRAVSIGAFVWWNREFGLFLLGSSIAWSFFEVVFETSCWKKNMAQIALEIGFAFTVIIASNTGSVSDLAYYNLIGIGAPVTRWGDVYGWLALWGGMIGTLVWMRFFREKGSNVREQQHLLDIAGIGLINATLITVYVIWNQSPNHVAVLWLCSVIPCTALTLWLVEVASNNNDQLQYLARNGTAIAISMLLILMIVNQSSYEQFERVFKDHRMMHWQFANLMGTSTGDPEVMHESVALIEKYQPQGRILLLSRYDSLLPILSNRLTGLPYVELPGALVSQEMIEKISTRILQSDTPYLFVDRNIFDEFEWQVRFDKKGKPEPQDSLKVGTMAAMEQVFHRVGNCFVPGETRGALQVWHRNCPVLKR